MAKMKKQTRLIFIAIIFISLFQNPLMAATPAIEIISSKIFPQQGLAAVQAGAQTSFMMLVVSAALSAFLVSRGFITKKGTIVFGLLLQGSVAVLALALHTQFWHFIAYNVLLGIASGIFIPNVLGGMIDFFNPEERRLVSGVHEIMFSAGGIIFSLLGGVIAPHLWYGGYLAAAFCIPCAIYCQRVMPGSLLPRNEKGLHPTGVKPTPLPRRIWLYAVFMMLTMLLYNVCGNNISTHIAQNGMGSSTLAGTANAIMLCGGIAAGIAIVPLEKTFGEHVMALTFLMLTVSFALIYLAGSSFVIMCCGCFFSGVANSLAMPHTILSLSKIVDESNSSLATMIATCLFASGGSFLSPVIMTNVTQTLFGASTAYRYLFTAGVSLVLAALAFAVNFKVSAAKAVTEQAQ